VRQILVAYGYYDVNKAPEFREGVKYFEEKKTDIFLGDADHVSHSGSKPISFA
jgi:hypothetical protein